MTKALLLIEFQQEWLSTTGKLYLLIDDPNRLQHSMRQAQHALTYARQHDFLVIHSGLSFNNYESLGKASLGLRAHIPQAKTFMANSNSSNFYPDFTPLDNELLVTGRLGASAFAGSNLDAQLRYNGVTELYIMGYALHVCVESTLRAAHDLGYETRVIADACAAFTEEQEQYFLNHVINHFGQATTAQLFTTGA